MAPLPLLCVRRTRIEPDRRPRLDRPQPRYHWPRPSGGAFLDRALTRRSQLIPSIIKVAPLGNYLKLKLNSKPRSGGVFLVWG
jgi:hypothetical protein